MRSLTSYEGMPDSQPFFGTLNYIYGLSDFWTVWFEDKEVLDRTMEATSLQLSEIYSRFLQSCSTVSLHDIRSTFHSDLTLLLIEENRFDQSYSLPVSASSVERIYNNASTPTVTLVRDTDFKVESTGPTSCVVYFSQHLADIGFPVVSIPKIIDGRTEVNQFSLWVSTGPVGSATLVHIEDDSDFIVNATFAYQYKLQTTAQSIEYLFNKPLAPTLTLEKNVHFHVEEISPSESILYLTKPISEFGFPVRKVQKNADSFTEVNQYSVWASDVEIDVQSLWTYFGQFVRVSPATSTKLFKDYITGLYHLYLGGPTIDLLGRGLNLALGIPLARATEVILRIVVDPSTGNYSVITANNSYTIPYQIAPVVAEGDVVNEGKEISWVATVEDYRTKDNWWINMAIPSRLFKGRPVGVPAVATEGSDIDYYMKTFLKTHTFLVKVDIAAEFTTESMAELTRLVMDAKPVYTYPVMVWSIPLSEEQLRETDDLTVTPTINMIDSLVYGEYLTRNHPIGDIAGERSCRVFIHSNGPETAPGSGGKVTVNVKVLDGLTGSTYVTITDDTMVPLYNIKTSDLKTTLTALGYSVPATLPNRFRLTNVDMQSNYGLGGIVRRNPLNPVPGLSYNTNDLGLWEGEVHRCYVPHPTPGAGGVGTSETMVFTQIMTGLYSVFWIKPAHSLAFDPYYFPPAVEDPLTITQVPV